LENGYVQPSNVCFISQKSCICDPVDLIEKLKGVNISENTIISSFDIVSMYTNINVAESEKLLENK